MTETETVYYTRLARLLASGWQASDEIARPIMQREALWAALAELSANVRHDDPLTAPVLLADREGAVAAVIGHAVGMWCDQELQRLDSRVHTLNAHFRNALSKEIAKDPAAVLSSLQGVVDDDGDAQAIAAEARGYIEASSYMFSAQTGRQIRAKPAENYGEVIPRQVRPLVSRANIERSDRLGKANRQKITEATMAAVTKR